MDTDADIIIKRGDVIRERFYVAKHFFEWNATEIFSIINIFRLSEYFYSGLRFRNYYLFLVNSNVVNRFTLFRKYSEKQLQKK